MIQWSTNRINPAVSARTTPAGTPRQSAATAAPIASRGAQFRSAALSRSAPTTIQRASKIDDEDDDDKKPKKEPFLSRDEEDPNDDVLDNPDDNETDDEPDEDKDNVIIVVS